MSKSLTEKPLAPVLGGEGFGVRGLSEPSRAEDPHPRPLSLEYKGEGRAFRTDSNMKLAKAVFSADRASYNR